MELVKSHITNLDHILGGGFPRGSLNFIAGSPGTGKTIFAHQMLFNSTAKSLYISTLSEPMTKILTFMQKFDYFHPDEFGKKICYRDLGSVLRKSNLEDIIETILSFIDETNPEIICIDSFKAISDIIDNEKEFRKFCYELAVHLNVNECTTFLIGEYSKQEIFKAPEFAIGDGIIFLSIAEMSGEKQRIIEILKLRGQEINLEPFPFFISSNGLKIFNPEIELKNIKTKPKQITKLKTGIEGLDYLLYGGIPAEKATMVSGVSGTGKTTFILQFLAEGAENNEKGLLISTEETPDNLRLTAQSFGLDYKKYEEEGLIRIIYIPQNEISINKNINEIINITQEFQPSRVVLDSFSVFLNKIKEPSIQREKAFTLVSIFNSLQVSSIFISDIESGQNKISRFGIEETVMDGVIILSSTQAGHQRKRYIEVYKMRSSNHVHGQYGMEIGNRGICVYYIRPQTSSVKPKSLEFRSIEQIVTGLKYGTSWLTQGEQGSGKSTLAYQFAIEGLRRKESVLFVSLESSSDLVKEEMENWQILVDPYIGNGYLKILDIQNGQHNSNDSLEIEDLDKLLYTLAKTISNMPKPCRVIIDSLNPIAIYHQEKDFVRFIEYKNRILRNPEVVIFETILTRSLDESTTYNLLNSYDIVFDLYQPDWGEMEHSGHGMRAIRVRKARGSVADNRLYPYLIKPGDGIVIQGGIYR